MYGTDGSTEIGAIHKKYRGYIAEAMTSADQFAIRSMKITHNFKKSNILKSFFLVPMDLDVKMKAVALGALFLIVRFYFTSIVLFLFYRIFLISLDHLHEIIDIYRDN